MKIPPNRLLAEKETEIERLKKELTDACYGWEAAQRAMEAERERCATIALEQRCERGTPWDLACVRIAAAIRAVGINEQLSLIDDQSH